MRNRLGVCSWSVQPRDPGELVERLRALGLPHTQLALDPLRTGEWSVEETTLAFERSGVRILSGMMGTKGEDYSTLETIRATGGLRPDEHWKDNRQASSTNAALARSLGLELVTLHAGFLPEDPSSSERATLLNRLREVVDRFAAEDVRVAFETGQETASLLLGFLEELDRPDAGVNFDPANMILYDKGEPLEAFEVLAPWVRQIHLKDAVRTRVSGEWGEEVPLGSGDVDWPGFFALIRKHELDCDLLIEREAGSDRIRDIRRARDLARRELDAGGSA